MRTGRVSFIFYVQKTMWAVKGTVTGRSSHTSVYVSHETYCMFNMFARIPCATKTSAGSYSSGVRQRRRRRHRSDRARPR